jgi:hypothetical protein
VKETTAFGVAQVAGSEIEVVAVAETVAVPQIWPLTMAFTVPLPPGTAGMVIVTGFVGFRFGIASVPVPLAGTVTVDPSVTPLLVKTTVEPGTAQAAGSVMVVAPVALTVPAVPQLTPFTVAWMEPVGPEGTVTVTPGTWPEATETIRAQIAPVISAMGRFISPLPKLLSRCTFPFGVHGTPRLLLQ